MKEVPNWWQRFKIKLRLGVPFASTEIHGQCDEVWIQYKEFYISILVSVETGEPVSLGWQDYPPPNRIPVRDILIVKPVTEDK